MGIQFDRLPYDAEVLLMAYGGHQHIFVMPSLLSRRCWLFISTDLVESGFLDNFPKQRSLVYLGVSPTNPRFNVYTCTWADSETALRS